MQRRSPGNEVVLGDGLEPVHARAICEDVRIVVRAQAETEAE
jgi:hypothetical protein